MLFSDLFNVAAIGGKSPRDYNCAMTLIGQWIDVKRSCIPRTQRARETIFVARWACPHVDPPAQISFAVARNRGATRALVSCSNAYASFIRVGSLQAGPKNDRPTGSPK